MRRWLAWDWTSPLRIAGATLGTSLALAVVFGLASRPASGHLDWGFKTTLAWLAWVWESIFGVNAVGSLQANGSLGFLGFSIDGSASGSGSLAAMPLTLTVATLLVAAIAFRRATASSPSAVAALLLGVRAALLSAIPLVLVSLVISLGANDLTGLLGASSGDGSAVGDTLQQWQALNGQKSLSISLSSTDAFFVTIALLTTLFASLTLMHAEWFTGRIWSTVHLCLAAPVRAFGRLGIGVVASGLLFELVIWLVRWNTSWPSGEHRPALSAHQWVNGFASAIAYAGNAGAMALGLGSLGSVGYSASGSVSAPMLSESRSPHQDHWIGWFAQTDHLASGVWIALALAPLVLIYVARSVARVHGSDDRSVLTSLGTWLISLVVAIPALAALANLSVSGSGSADTTFVSGTFAGHGAGSLTLGMSTLVCTFTVFVYALIISGVVALRLRTTPSERSSAADTDLQSLPR
jgi:hypothetical protein